MADPKRPASGVWRAVLLRLFYGLVSLVFISLVTFLADEIAPGDAATAVAGEKATQAQVERLRTQMGLDRPWPIRYVEFVGHAVKFDFGESYFGTKEPVNTILGRALPMTMTLAGSAIVLAAILGISLGTVAAVWQNKPPDRIALTMSTLGVTVPNFVLAPILVYIFAVRMDKLPTTWEVNRVAPDFFYLILPVVVLSARPAASLTRLTRASMVDTLSQEFIRLAVAKGVPPWQIYLKHALRNAILPVLTSIGTSFGYLLTGSFVVETIFTMPGLGHAAIDAILKGDTPLILASTLVSGALFVLVNLLVDMVLPMIDPRIRESQI
ncbi:MAG: ABC transporter permease [Armatimonadetes bacterium]|nr:ABC transporter permease [Armatimonadota bacterium]